ncbi:Cytochrome P450 71A1 [Acorus calamus]|uniref:Cytochrome P450 71A1 n=1 Tax=Acorus calamus TaxID=4465 RepID=A0AAV9F439_ACOCL|nr:Cytochrome P450 71A1 [Acorus calamus]
MHEVGVDVLDGGEALMVTNPCTGGDGGRWIRWGHREGWAGADGGLSLVGVGVLVVMCGGRGGGGGRCHVVLGVIGERGSIDIGIDHLGHLPWLPTSDLIKVGSERFRPICISGGTDSVKGNPIFIEARFLKQVIQTFLSTTFDMKEIKASTSMQIESGLNRTLPPLWHGWPFNPLEGSNKDWHKWMPGKPFDFFGAKSWSAIFHKDKCQTCQLRLRKRDTWKECGNFSTNTTTTTAVVATLDSSNGNSARQRRCSEAVAFDGSGGSWRWDIGFSPYREQWRKVRKIGTLHLFNSKKVLSFRGVREKTVAHMIENIRIALASSSGLVNLSKVFKSYVVESIATVTFGEALLGEGMSERIQRLVEENGKLLFELHLEDLFPSYKWLEFFTGLNARVTKTFHGWDNLFDELIDAHIRAVGGADEGILTLWMFYWHSKRRIVEMVQSSPEMTSKGFYRNPNVMTKLKEEIEETIKGKCTVDEDDISQMEYLRAIFKETLRLHPPAPLLIPRESTEDTTIQYFMIPARTRVFVNAWAIQRDTEYWESPEEFLPERFLRNSLDFSGNDFKFFPFGGGRRICPGVHIGISNFELVLANVIHHFEWKLLNGMKERDLNMDEKLLGLSSR